MINCIAIDDEPLSLQILSCYASQIQGMELIKTFTNPLKAQNYLRKFPVDLLFLDIQMPDVSGINFYKSIGQNKMVIFTTAHSEFAVEGFNLNAIDYLLKPFEFERFKLAVNKAIEHQKYLAKHHHAEKSILIRSEYKLVKVLLKDIEFIESYDDFIKIHILGNKPVLTLMSLKVVIEMLPADQFIRIHRSYIIPLNQITSIRNNRVQLRSTELPVGNRYKDDFLKWYKEDH
jgi:two-component system, LytTR family, response regulator